MNIKVIDSSEVKYERGRQVGEGEKSCKTCDRDDSCDGNDSGIFPCPDYIDKRSHSLCERVRRGETDNCALCEGLNKEMYDRCKIKG